VCVCVCAKLYNYSTPRSTYYLLHEYRPNFITVLYGACKMWLWVAHCHSPNDWGRLCRPAGGQMGTLGSAGRPLQYFFSFSCLVRLTLWGFRFAQLCWWRLDCSVVLRHYLVKRFWRFGGTLWSILMVMPSTNLTPYLETMRSETSVSDYLSQDCLWLCSPCVVSFEVGCVVTGAFLA